MEYFIEQSFHGILDLEVWLRGVGYVDKHQVKRSIKGFWKEVLAVEAVGFSDTTAHKHAVYGMAEALFGHRDYELDGIPAHTGKVFPPDSPEGIGQGALDIALGEEAVNGCLGAKTGGFGKPVIVHNLGSPRPKGRGTGAQARRLRGKRTLGRKRRN